MKLEKGKVSGLGIVLLIIGYIFGSALIVFPGAMVGRDAWIAQIIGLGAALVIAWIFSALLSRFPGKTIIEISESVFGSFFGGTLSILFLWFLFHLGSLTLTSYLDFIKLMILPLTPAAIVVFLVILPCIYTAKKGVEVIVRSGQVLVPIVGIFFLLIALSQINNYDFSNFKPVLTTPLPKLLWAGLLATVFPFTETVSFLMILPFLNKQGRVRFTLLTGLILGGLIVVLAVVRTTLVLGDTATLYMYPAYYSVRIINIADLLNRFEILAAINYLIMGFLKVTVILYGVSLGCAQAFKFTSYRPLVIPLGVLMGLISLNNFHHVPQHLEFFNKAFPIYALPFELGIPILVFLGALIKGLSGGVDR